MEHHQPRRKLLIATDNFLPRWDGIARFLLEIIPRLRERFDITVIAPKITEQEVVMPELDGVRIVRIERHATRGRDAFEHDELIQNWVISHIQIIGEACRAVSTELRAQHHEVPWRAIIGMRNVLVHRYFGIDQDAVWAAVEQDLPDLKRAVTAILGAWEEDL